MTIFTLFIILGWFSIIAWLIISNFNKSGAVIILIFGVTIIIVEAIACSHSARLNKFVNNDNFIEQRLCLYEFQKEINDGPPISYKYIVGKRLCRDVYATYMENKLNSYVPYVGNTELYEQIKTDFYYKYSYTLESIRQENRMLEANRR